MSKSFTDRLPRAAIIGLTGLCLLALAACRERSEQATPDWLAAQREAILAEPLSNPPSRFYRYRYRGEVVYYRPPRCCDVFGELYDAKGTLLCHPDGGFSGRGDGRCPDFAAARGECELVWVDPRAKGAGPRGCPQGDAPEM